MSEIYADKEFAEKWDAHQRSKEDFLRTKMMNLILLKDLKKYSGKSILDAGCGNGFFIPSLLGLKPLKLSGFDISEGLVDLSKQRYVGVDFKVADIMKKLPYEDNSFDCTVCYNVLMDIPKIDFAVKELSRITKGEIFIVVVHPLYNLFMNDVSAKSEDLINRLKRYLLEESLLVGTIPGYDKFEVYRRPISMYINEFVKNGLKIVDFVEVPVSEELIKFNSKYGSRAGLPVFAYFRLSKL